MDDSAQKQNQANDMPQIQVKTTQSPPNPVSSPNKEVEAAPVSDYLVPSAEIESIIKDKEVTDAGVKEVSQTPNLKNEHFNVGIKHSGEATPVQREPTGAVVLPMTKSEAMQSAKGSTADAATWLANFILRLLKKMRISSAAS